MDTASKLIDLLVEWGRRGKRWPLLLILIVPAYFIFFKNYYDIAFRQTVELKQFLWLSSATVLLSIFLYILLEKYDRIVYSRAMDLLRRGPRVAITKTLAWPTITYEDGTGVTESITIVRELARMLRELHIRPVVISVSQTEQPQVTRRDQFVLDGVVSGVGLVFRSVVMMREAHALELAERLMRGVGSGKESPETSSVTVPLARVLDIQFLVEMSVCNLSIPAGQSNEQRTAIIRVFLRQALVAMLYRDQNPAAKDVAQMMVDLGDFLAPVENAQIAKIYKTASFNFITVDDDFSEGLRALRIAAKFDPADHTVIALQIILSLKLKHFQEAQVLLGQMEAAISDKALLAWLKADFCSATGLTDDAIAAFEEAIALEENPEHQATLHFYATFAYATAKTLDEKHQADGMIRHLEDAIHIDDNPTYHALKGYAWALRRNLVQFEAEFAKTAVSAESLPAPSREALNRFAENWKARGLRKLHQSSKIAENVLSVIGSPEESHDVANLLVLAGAALDLAGIRGDEENLAAAERYVNRVIELQPRSGEALRYRAITYYLRFQNATDAAVRALNGEKAREALLMSVRVGDEYPDSHALLANLYESDGDPVNAAKHRGRWLELAPDDPDARAYQALTILDRTGRIADAEAHLANLEGKGNELGTVYQRVAIQALAEGLPPGENLREGEPAAELCDAAARCLLKARMFGDLEPRASNLLVTILIDLAVMHQNAGRLDAAAECYLTCLNVDVRCFAAQNNVAFLLFDRDEVAEALRHWDEALQIEPDNADATAGKAAALYALGSDEEALACYKRAVSLSGDFLDENLMHDTYLWSEKALGAVRAFITNLSGKGPSSIG
jgi:tetratricopeptide (TPR) repeat protein